MKTPFIIVFLIFATFNNIYSQDIKYFEVLNFSELEPRLNKNNDTVYVINFWATWCVPCRKELPEFEKIRKVYYDKEVKILLVSLDFPNQQGAVKSFIEKNQIMCDVVILNAPDANSWIDKVDKNWSGSLPFTLIYKNEVKKNYEGEINYKTIETQIISMLNL